MRWGEFPDPLHYLGAPLDSETRPSRVKPLTLLLLLRLGRSHPLPPVLVDRGPSSTPVWGPSTREGRDVPLWVRDDVLTTDDSRTTGGSGGGGWRRPRLTSVPTKYRLAEDAPGRGTSRSHRRRHFTLCREERNLQLLQYSFGNPVPTGCHKQQGIE